MATSDRKENGRKSYVVRKSSKAGNASTVPVGAEKRLDADVVGMAPESKVTKQMLEAGVIAEETRMDLLNRKLNLLGAGPSDLGNFLSITDFLTRVKAGEVQPHTLVDRPKHASFRKSLVTECEVMLAEQKKAPRK
tara:strand:+ start:270 stop:677 length:408 start_codon:yes stop_codon:yes gene_type:complete